MLAFFDSAPIKAILMSDGMLLVNSHRFTLWIPNFEARGTFHSFNSRRTSHSWLLGWASGALLWCARRVRFVKELIVRIYPSSGNFFPPIKSKRLWWGKGRWSNWTYLLFSLYPSVQGVPRRLLPLSPLTHRSSHDDAEFTSNWSCCNCILLASSSFISASRRAASSCSRNRSSSSACNLQRSFGYSAN